MKNLEPRSGTASANGGWLRRLVRPLGIFIIIWIFWSLFSWCVLQFCNPTQKYPENHKSNNSNLNQTNALLHGRVEIVNNPLRIWNRQMRCQSYQINAAGKLKQQCPDEYNQQKHANPSGSGIICSRMIVGNERRARHGCQC